MDISPNFDKEVEPNKVYKQKKILIDSNNHQEYDLASSQG